MPSTSPAPISKGSEDAARRVDAGEPPPPDTAPTTEANDHAPTIEIGRQSQLLDASLQDPGVGQYVGPGTGTMTRLALAAGFVGGGACSLVAATAIWVWRNRAGRAAPSSASMVHAPLPSWTTDDLVAWLRNPG